MYLISFLIGLDILHLDDIIISSVCTHIKRKKLM